MRPLTRGCAALLAAVALFAVAAPAANADEHCPDGYVCVWNGSAFDYGKVTYGAANAGSKISIGLKNSAKNRFANRAVRFTLEIWGITVGRGCLNPGEKAGNGSFAATHMVIGGPGSRC